MLQRIGLIPAHAGKTTARCERRGRRRAHPRSRGENAAHALAEIYARGLIPAHAGKTAVLDADREELGAHPRSRGENLGGGAARPEDDGSSPLTRGKPPVPSRCPGSPWLIPAHAGKTNGR